MIAEQVKKKCNEKITVYNKLPILEVSIYYIGWISGMFYMLYGVYLTSNEYQNRNEFLVNGWSFMGLKKDVSDPVIEITYQAIGYIIFYGILHYVLGELVKSACRKVLPYYYFLFSISIITYYTSYKFGIFLIIQALLSFTITYFGDKFYIWSFGLTAIVTVYFPQENLLFELCNLQNSQIPILLSLLMWNNLRYLAFALHNINKQKETEIYQNFVNFLGYYFYFPTVCQGPLLLYEDFQNVYYKIHTKEMFYKRFFKFIVSIIKCTLYLYLVTFLLHFLHSELLYQMPFIHTGYFASHGFFWWAGFSFMLKHTILYGFGSAAATAEGITSPNTPKCIGRIALYSEMWKNFDQSMYWFKKRYIFEAFVKESKSKLKKMIGSFLCFIFVIVWHGGRYEIIIWALVNHAEVVLEELGKILSRTELFLTIYKNYLNPKYLRRITALFSVPLLSISCISQYLFFSNNDIIKNFIKRITKEHYLINGLVLFIAYCACQVSIEVKMREKFNNKALDKKYN